MTLGRRNFLKGGAAAAAAAPLLAQSAVAAERNHLLGRMKPDAWDIAEAATEVLYPASGAGKPLDPIRALLIKGLRKQLDAADERYRDRLAYRSGAFEADIAGLNSVSLQHKIAMQRRRDDARYSVVTKLRDQIWPKND